MTAHLAVRRRRREPWGDLVRLDREAAMRGGGPIAAEAVALVTARHEAEGLETVRVMLQRAGRPLRAVLVVGCEPWEPVVVDALARRLDARLLVLASAPAFAASVWLARAEAALVGRGAMAFEAGSGEPGAVALDPRWAGGRLGGPLLRSDLPGREALAELVADARAEGVLVRDPAAVLLDLDPPGGWPMPRGVRVEEVDVGEVRDLDPGEPGTPVVVLPCVDLERGRDAAARLAARAGTHARFLIALDAERRGFVATLNAVGARLGARRLAYAAEDAYPGPDWLARGLAALDAPGVSLVGLNCGKWEGRLAAFGCLRLDWARGLYDGAVMHPGYHAHRADNELTVIARAQGTYVYEPTAIVLERDAGKVLRARASGTEASDPADRRLFHRRFAGAFDGRAPRAALAALAEDYLSPGRAPRARAKLEAADG